MGENTPRDRTKISRAQRDIEEEKKEAAQNEWTDRVVMNENSKLIRKAYRRWLCVMVFWKKCCFHTTSCSWKVIHDTNQASTIIFMETPYRVWYAYVWWGTTGCFKNKYPLLETWKVTGVRIQKSVLLQTWATKSTYETSLLFKFKAKRCVISENKALYIFGSQEWIFFGCPQAAL